MQKSGKFHNKLGMPEGSAFPTESFVEDGDLFYRTDLDDAYVLKDGTWTSITLGGGSGVGGAVYKILLYSNDVTEYDVDDAGMASALAAAVSGDTIKIPPTSLNGPYTIPSGVTIVGESKSDSVFTKQVTINQDVNLEDLSITVIENDSNIHFGILGPLVGTGYLKGCWISCINTGGSGYGVGARNGTLEIHGGEVYGSTTDAIENWSE